MRSSLRALAEGIERVVDGRDDLSPEDSYALGVAAGVLMRLSAGPWAAAGYCPKDRPWLLGRAAAGDS